MPTRSRSQPAKVGRKRATSKAASRRRPANQAEKRMQIRQAAYRCFSRGGYEHTTVDDICEELGISKGSFYWYFDGKQEVFLDILSTWAKEVEDEMARQFHGALAAADPFTAMTHALEREGCRGRVLMPVWLEFLAHVGRDQKVRKALSAFHKSIRNSIDGMLRPILPAVFRPQDRAALAAVIMSIFMGLVCQELVDPHSVDYQSTIRRFMMALQFYVEASDKR